MIIVTQIIVWTTPDDPTAGSMAIMVIITAPVGAIIGTILGPIIALKCPKLFRYLVVPASVLTAGIILLIILNNLINS